jgi:TonB family protein
MRFAACAVLIGVVVGAAGCRRDAKRPQPEGSAPARAAGAKQPNRVVLDDSYDRWLEEELKREEEEEALRPREPWRRLLPPAEGARRKTSGSDPEFPRKPRNLYGELKVMTKICVSARGTVDDVKIFTTSGQEYSAAVVAAVKKWRYEPLSVERAPVPFCTLAKFLFVPPPS